ncbi:hypothetical protein K2173_018765 [Erythroxylum novogranatense]|uniref:30S ribosomal protein 3, chloroplastic n=1 Tax=Erythroxylum novogranatense TaxID=1862640 RepID=A0AAV8T1X6_9ROSI|nr:hypothetical protein K2173_018765 [Erythroxylum novogranatense]
MTIFPSTINNFLTFPVICFQNPTLKCFHTSFSISSKLNLIPQSSFQHRNNLLPRNQRLAPFAVPATLTSESNSPPSMEADQPISDEGTETTEITVKKVEKPRLVLKFIWMEKNIGLALDQVIPGHGSVPLSPYFFWPRKDAWEELKAALESKPWISQKKMIILLNQATDIINLWQQSGGITSS